MNGSASGELSAVLTDIPPVPAPSKETSSQKEWTVMLFMNGKSNVEPFAVRDMNRLETVGSSDKVNVVVELGRMSGQSNDTDADGNWTGSRRYLAVKDADAEKITSPVLMEIPEIDMGDWRRAADFVKWAKAQYPARRYLLIIWDHGWGWIDPKKGSDIIRAKSISHDFETGNYIKTSELADIFRSAGGVDVYASMACFMQMAEVAWEIRDYAGVIVGSEEVIQLPSFNFEGFLSALEADPSAGAEQAGIYMVDTFKELYARPDIEDGLNRAKYGVQLSAIRAGRLGALAGKLDEWTALVADMDDRKAVLAAKEGVLRMEIGDEITDPLKKISFYGDLSHFIELVGANASARGADGVRRKGAEIMRFIAGDLVIRNAFVGKDRTGKDYSNARGLAVHIPGEPGTLIEHENSYSDLLFAKSTSWGGFTEYLSSVTAVDP